MSRTQRATSSTRGSRDVVRATPIDKGQELAGDAVDKGKDVLDGDKEPPASAPPA